MGLVFDVRQGTPPTAKHRRLIYLKNKRLYRHTQQPGSYQRQQYVLIFQDPWALWSCCLNDKNNGRYSTNSNHLGNLIEYHQTDYFVDKV